MAASTLRRGTVGTVVVATAVTAGLATTAPAHAADTTAPVLTAITRTSPAGAVPGDAVTFDYAATEESGSLASLTISYRDTKGRTQSHRMPGPLPVSGTVTHTLPDGLLNEVRTTLQVSVSDEAGNTATYLRNGEVTVTGAGSTTGHSLGLSALDVTVSGSTPELTVPTLGSLTTSTPAVSPGQEARWEVSASDPAGLASVTVAAGYVTGRSTPPVSSPVVAAGVVPESAPNGETAVSSVAVQDRLGNRATYRSDGTVQLFPYSGATGPTTHAVPFSAASLTVSGSTADYTPPVLTAVDALPSHVGAGQEVPVTYAATDNSGALSSLALEFSPTWGPPEGPQPMPFTLTVPGPLPLSGTVRPVLPASTYRTTYRLDKVSLSDGRNQVDYRAGGTTSRPGVTHSLDFDRSELTVAEVPRAASYAVGVAGDRAATVVWDPVDDGGAPLTGHTVTLSPSGRTVSLGAGTRRVTFTGLGNLTTYTVTVRARNAVGTGAAKAVKVIPRPPQRLHSPGDWTGDGRPDVVGVDAAGNMYLHRGNGRGGFSGSRSKVGHGWNAFRVVTAGRGPDEVGLLPRMHATHYDGSLWEYRGDEAGGFETRFVTSRGWERFAKVLTPGDLNGDLWTDVLAINDRGDLYLYRYKGNVEFYHPGVKVGSGWQGFRSVFATGDVTGDDRADIMAVSADGTLWLYPGNGRGGFGARRKAGSGWGGFTTVFSPGDFDGDRRNDVLAASPSGSLRLYRGNGRGGWIGGGTRIGSGWHTYR
ncbi:MAG TPA: FG-GAP-like repeat-containing protein [Pedococcus sp.]